jgi:hypothetical protein
MAYILLMLGPRLACLRVHAACEGAKSHGAHSQQRVRWRMDKVDVAFPWPGDRAVAVSANFGSWLLLGVVASFDVNEVF